MTLTRRCAYTRRRSITAFCRRCSWSRGLTGLTREVHQFKAPFDERFRDMMVATTEHLMNCGFRVVYGYTESDEISLLFHRDETSFGRKTRKYNSILAGEASAKFSLLLGDVAAFDCRICELP